MRVQTAEKVALPTKNRESRRGNIGAVAQQLCPDTGHDSKTESGKSGERGALSSCAAEALMLRRREFNVGELLYGQETARAASYYTSKYIGLIEYVRAAANY